MRFLFWISGFNAGCGLMLASRPSYWEPPLLVLSLIFLAGGLLLWEAREK
jgi:hypothetical protein